MPFSVKIKGVYYAQRRVPDHLQAAVAQLLNRRKAKQVFLKRSLGTKDRKQADISIKPVLIEFDRLLRNAELLENSKPPVRSALSVAEISHMAEYVYAQALAWDERLRVGGRDQLQRDLITLRKEAKADSEDPGEIRPFYRYDNLPRYGLSAAQLADNREQLGDDLRVMREALALSNISAVQDQIADALDTFGINLDPESPSYPALGAAILRRYVGALEAIGKRNEGHPIETPVVPQGPLSLPTANGGGATLWEAFEGWKKVRFRPDDTLTEYARAIKMFADLQGNLTIADIKRRHALEYRQAIQLVPRHRKGNLREATLPELVDWAKRHPDAPRVAAGTINKQLGAVQAISLWAYSNGLVPDDVAWVDPFLRMRIKEDGSDRAPFVTGELQTVFDDPLFTTREWPVGARGAAGVWLPLLGLFTGARQAELGSLKVSNIVVDADTSTPLMYIVRDRRTGQRAKTKSSMRVVPIHSQLVALGFLALVADRRRESGDDAWLFPLISPETGRAGVKAWSKWWGGYLRKNIGVKDSAKVFHSFRHGVKDALRRARVDYELREALIGHSHGSTVSGGYGAAEMLARWGVEALQDAISKISYPGLDLSRVHTTGVHKRSRVPSDARKATARAKPSTGYK